jgi:hypothetical protein
VGSGEDGHRYWPKMPQMPKRSVIAERGVSEMIKEFSSKSD